MLRLGQNPRRPKIVSSAGSTVRPASIAQKTEIAATGPSDLVLPDSANTRTSIARVTVSPLARMAGPPPPKGGWIASCLPPSRRGASLYFGTQKREGAVPPPPKQAT